MGGRSKYIYFKPTFPICQSDWYSRYLYYVMYVCIMYVCEITILEASFRYY